MAMLSAALRVDSSWSLTLSRNNNSRPASEGKAEFVGRHCLVDFCSYVVEEFVSLTKDGALADS